MVRFRADRFLNIAVTTTVFIGLFCTCDARGDEEKLDRISSGGDCVNPIGDPGICRKIGHCKYLLGLLVRNKSRPNSKAIDFIRKSHCGFDGIHPIVCCPIENKAKDGRGGINSNKPSLNVQTPNPCGSIRSVNKIIGGSVTTLTEFPWMALIGYKTKHGLQYRCGGSLVSSRYVLTAAHCVSALREIYPSSVRLGEYNLGTEEDCVSGLGCNPPPVDVEIEKVIPHPDYFKPELRNDIALIRLAENVQIKESIQPICLPLNKTISERSFSQIEKAVVTGWGTTETGRKSQVLLKVNVPIVSSTECSEVYKKKVPITESQICAGGEPGKDSCSGDSGGPLQVIGLDSRGQPAYFQEGIVSFGPRNCGEKGKPGVYTKVAHYADWIVENLNE